MIKPHGLWVSDTCDTGGNTHTGEEARNFSSPAFRVAIYFGRLRSKGAQNGTRCRVLSHSLVMSKLLRKASVYMSVRMSNPSFVTA